MFHDGIFFELVPELVGGICGIVSEGSGFISFDNELMGSNLAILGIKGRKNMNKFLVAAAGGGIMDLIQPLGFVHLK